VTERADLRLIFELARRDLRGGIKSFRIFLSCLALGVAAIAAVGSVATAVNEGLHRDARALLGGDIEVRLSYRAAGPEERAFLEGLGRMSHVLDMRAMARAEGARTLIEIKAVDANYPLYGQVELAGETALAPALAERNGIYGAAVDANLMARLGLELGGKVRVGDAEFELRATILREPDRGTQTLTLGPRLMMSAQALATTGLLQPGTLVNHAHRIALADAAKRELALEELKARFPQAGWRLRDYTQATPGVERFIGRLAMFLSFVGLTALLIGGVGVGNAIKAYLATKTATIATLKCIGATGSQVFAVYLTQVLILSALGIAIGLVVGAATPFLASGALAAVLPSRLEPGPYPLPLALAALFGLLVALAFSLWPLARAREIPPTSLFRELVAELPRWPRTPYFVLTGLAVLALSTLAIATAQDKLLAAGFVAGAAIAFLVFRLAARGLIFLGRRGLAKRGARVRFALGNLDRPGAATGDVALSLGLGVTVLVAIALIEGNVGREVVESMPSRAPAFYFIDLQPNQIAEFDRTVRAVPGFEELRRVPMLRGRIVKLAGKPVEELVPPANVAWVLRGDRGLTYTAERPSEAVLVAGQWWPPDYRGPPLVSFDAEIAKGFGLKLGDSITINLLGREITATIANLRKIEWQSLAMNFTLIFAPGALEGAPQTFLATVRAEAAAEAAMERAVTDKFPNVSSIRVKEALASIAEIVDRIAIAVRGTALVTLLAGGLVLAGAVAAQSRRRIREAVLLKVLGATRRDVLGILALEYGLLGAATAAIASATGTAAGYAVLVWVMGVPWRFLGPAVLLTATLALVFALVFGIGGTARALGQKAAPILRNP
jgi:putative ABC transport system permease protein